MQHSVIAPAGCPLAAKVAQFWPPLTPGDRNAFHDDRIRAEVNAKNEIREAV